MNHSFARHFELRRGQVDTPSHAMEGLRGLAVTLVFLVHYVTLTTPWVTRNGLTDQWAQCIHRLGNAGVDLFFVLSGYLIYRTLMTRSQPYIGFMRRRIRRIYPAFLVVFAVHLALALSMGSSKLPTDGVERWIYILQNLLLLPGLFPIEPLIAVAWSLSYEFFFYIVLPLWISGLRLRQQPASRRILLLCGVAVAMLLTPQILGSHIRMTLFIAGMMVHELMQGGRRISAATGMTAGLLALASTQLAPSGPWSGTYMTGALSVGFGLLCAASLNHQVSQLTTILSWSPIRWLGNMSYSYYLMHGLALHAWVNVLERVAPPDQHPDALFWLSMLPAFMFTLLPSAALFLFVEKPLSLTSSSAAPSGAKAT
jgi:exopolysaccharide production protein ExoZ